MVNASRTPLLDKGAPLANKGVSKGSVLRFEEGVNLRLEPGVGIVVQLTVRLGVCIGLSRWSNCYTVRNVTFLDQRVTNSFIDKDLFRNLPPLIIRN